MKANADFSLLCESFFARRLIAQLKASQHTISAYAYTFRLLLKFAQKRLGIPPSKLTLTDLNGPLLAEFLDDLEVSRANSARSRNTRLAAIRQDLLTDPFCRNAISSKRCAIGMSPSMSRGSVCR